MVWTVILPFFFKSYQQQWHYLQGQEPQEPFILLGVIRFRKLVEEEKVCL